MAWAAGVGAAVGGGMGLMSGSLNNAAALSRQHQAQDFSGYMYGNRYTLQVADLKRAGLNPMLAYTNGAPSAPSSSAASSSGYDSNIGNNAVSSYNNTRLASAQEAKTKQETDESAARTTSTEIENNYRDAQMLALVKNLNLTGEQLTKTTEKIAAEIENVKAQYNNILNDTKLKQSTIEYNDALKTTQSHLQKLYDIQAVLTESNSYGTILDNLIKSPKAKAAGTASAARAAEAENYRHTDESFERANEKRLPSLFNILSNPWK